MSFTAIAAALVFVAALAHTATDAYASEQAVPADDRPGTMDLRVAEGKLSGKFDNRPLFEVLEAIGSQAGFEYQGYKEVLSHPMTGNFEGLDLINAVERILEPFNYVMVFKRNGEIRRLHIVSFRGASAGTRVPPQTGSLTPAFTYEPGPPTNFGPTMEDHLLDLTFEERRLFEVADDELGPPPELVQYFEPESAELEPLVAELFDMAGQKLGPPPEFLDYFAPAPAALDPNVSELFEMATQKLGPPPELLEYFEPVPEPGSEETGPQVPPNVAVYDLPKFEPYVREAGPSAGRLEID